MTSKAPGLLRERRRWRFSSVEFDEVSWTLSVGGRQVEIESKPLEVLRALLLRPGEMVTKSELFDAVWPDVTVVEASLSTAVRKLRRALGDTEADRGLIETVPRLGYRLAVPVELDIRPAAAPSFSGDRVEQDAPEADTVLDRRGRPFPPLSRPREALLALSALLPVLIGGWFATARLWNRDQPAAVPPLTQREEKDALRTLDLPRIEVMLRRGWNPNTPLDAEGNGALNVLLNDCDWNPGHDKQRLLLVARTLYDAGARIDVRNVWGDTPYSIAKARRYCGPDHPVTQMLRKICFTGNHAFGDKCLAKYPPKNRPAVPEGKTRPPAHQLTNRLL